MTDFLLGFLAGIGIWCAFEIFRNPHGHRGGQPFKSGGTVRRPSIFTIGPEDGVVVPMGSIPVRYHRTG